MIVCICHRVSDRDIAHAARQGCASFDELQDELLVGTGCGACGDCARDTFEAQRCASGAAAGGAWAAIHLVLTTPPLVPQPAAAP